jgi:hypothetical protein
MHSEDTQSDNFDSNAKLVQKIKFAMNLEELKKVVSNSTGEYLELAVGVTSESEYVAVLYSNSIGAKDDDGYEALGKACPPSTKCPPAN